MANKGHARERQVRRVLEEEGWWVARAAGSLGDADLVASRPVLVSRDYTASEVRLVEVKATAGGPYSHFLPADRARLIAAAELAGATAWLAWWPPRKPLVWLPWTEWPGGV